MAFEFTISYTNENTLQSLGRFNVGYVSGPPTSSGGINTVETHKPIAPYNLKDLATRLSGSNLWYDCYVGPYPEPMNKLGFKLRCYTQNYQGSTYYWLFFQNIDTGCIYKVPIGANNNFPVYLCLSYNANIDNSNRIIRTKADLRNLLEEYKTLYRSKSTMHWNYGMDWFESAVLVACFTDSQSRERPFTDYSIDFPQLNGMYSNLSTFWNWYSFITGEFYYNPPYLETLAGKKIYLSVNVDGYDNDPLFPDSEHYPFQSMASQYAPPHESYDFQSGSDLTAIAGLTGSRILLKSGSILECVRHVDSNNRNYYLYSVGNSNNPLTIVQTAFNARMRIGDCVNVADPGSFNSRPFYESFTTDAESRMYLEGVFLWLSPKVGKKTLVTYISNNEDQNEDFWNEFDTTPITIAGVYKAYWNSPSSKYPVVNDRRTAWKKYGNLWFSMMVSNISGYRDASSDTYTTLINLFSSLSYLTATISAFMPGNGGTIDVDTAERARILWGIEAAPEPEDPTSGEGSIGGGGGSGGTSGGGGSYDDTGDNVGFSLGSSFGATSALTNYYIGELGDSNLNWNLDRLGDWFKSPIQLSAQDFSGIFYKYSDKLNNICSLKVLYTPEHANVLDTSWHMISIHGQQVRGNDITVNPMQGIPVVNQFKQSIIVLNFRLDEYFGSFLDYEGHTKIQIYLPFVGVHELNPSDIVGKDISIHATIDFLSGDIVYNIRSNTGTCNSILYTFSGNCSVDLPLTTTDYSGKVAAMGQVLAGGAMAAQAVLPYTGGAGVAIAALGGAVAGGATGGLTSSYKTTTKGSVGGTIGAMSPMQCYLIVNRPKKIEAESYGQIVGFPCMSSYRLTDVTGFVKVHSCQWSIPGATEEEIDEIDRLMKSEGAIF